MKAPDPGADDRAAAPAPGAHLLTPWEPPPSVPSGPPGSYEDRVRLALRIVVHLSRVPLPGEDRVALPELTQQGMATALGVTQGAVSKVIRRLVAAEIARPERCHVRGQDRRVRVYLLTQRGLGLAQEIQGRYPLPRSPDGRFVPPRGAPTVP